MTLVYGDTLFGRALYSAANTVMTERITAWPLSVDGHTYYVLNLGSQGSVLFDIVTQQWIDWAGFGRVGLNSKEGGSYGDLQLLGNDETGTLLYFNPESYEDYDGSIVSYVTGGWPIRSTEYKDCFAFHTVGYLTGLEGKTVELYASDDNGETYTGYGALTDGDNAIWRSLGIMEPPLRIFTVVDNGVFAKLSDFTLDV